jgi:hypothetical protein
MTAGQGNSVEPETKRIGLSMKALPDPAAPEKAHNGVGHASKFRGSQG